MKPLKDRIGYCQYCGAQLAEQGQVRCSECHRVERMPTWFWSAFAAAGGLASGGWAIVQEASVLAAIVSATLTAMLGYAFLSVTLGGHTRPVRPTGGCSVR